MGDLTKAETDCSTSKPIALYQVSDVNACIADAEKVVNAAMDMYTMIKNKNVNINEVV